MQRGREIKASQESRMHVAVMCVVVVVNPGGHQDSNPAAVFSVAVGANGSGKTNFFHGMSSVMLSAIVRLPLSLELEKEKSLTPNIFLFAAIRFVLSDLFHNLRAEDRQALLHVSFPTHCACSFVFEHLRSI